LTEAAATGALPAGFDGALPCPEAGVLCSMRGVSLAGEVSGDMLACGCGLAGAIDAT
jgi:hypothetical protein